MLLWRNSELIVKAMMPDLCHLAPVIHDPMFNGVVELKYPLLGDGFLPDICLFISQPLHDFLVLGRPDH
jgi:hypothetical protein